MSHRHLQKEFKNHSRTGVNFLISMQIKIFFLKTSSEVRNVQREREYTIDKVAARGRDPLPTQSNGGCGRRNQICIAQWEIIDTDWFLAGDAKITG